MARHRAQRADKGFTTIECEKDLAYANVPEGSIIRLEDLVNLMANEMFPGGESRAQFAARCVAAFEASVSKRKTARSLPTAAP